MWGCQRYAEKWAEDNETLLTVNCRLHTKRQGSSWNCPSPRQAELIWMQTSAYNIQIFNIYSELGKALDWRTLPLQIRFIPVFSPPSSKVQCRCVRFLFTVVSLTSKNEQCQTQKNTQTYGNLWKDEIVPNISELETILRYFYIYDRAIISQVCIFSDRQSRQWLAESQMSKFLSETAPVTNTSRHRNIVFLLLFHIRVPIWSSGRKGFRRYMFHLNVRCFLCLWFESL